MVLSEVIGEVSGDTQQDFGLKALINNSDFLSFSHVSLLIASKVDSPQNCKLHVTLRNDSNEGSIGFVDSRSCVSSSVDSVDMLGLPAPWLF